MRTPSCAAPPPIRACGTDASGRGDGPRAMSPLTYEALLGMAAAGERLSALDGANGLVVALDSAPALTPAERRRVGAWLGVQPCPVIGIGTSLDDAPACDVLAVDARDLARIVQGIDAAPRAAAVFVQLLRVIDGLPLEAGLVAESLAYATLQGGPEHRAWLRDHRARPAAAPPGDGEAVALSRDGDRLHLRLDRPAQRNAMTVEMRDALVAALSLALADDSIDAVTIDGAGKCFSTGGDLDEFGTVPDPVTGHLVRSVALPGRMLSVCADRTRVRVHGACIGSGIEFPAFAGHVTAARDAWFQLPELRMGLIPGAGGCVSISRRIGRYRTAWMVLSGGRIDAETAHAWGLVDALD